MKIGFIGAGNMGSAIIKGYAASKAMTVKDPDELFVFDNDADKLHALASEAPSINVIEELVRLACICDALVLCVKPNIVDVILDEFAASEKSGEFSNKLIISIAASISIAHIKEKLGAQTRIIRVMPNTPAMVGEGMSAMSASDTISDTDSAAAERLFGAVGVALWVPEDLMDIVTGVSGSSPAYAYLFIEGLARAGIEGGMSKDEAIIFAAQSTLGAAKMVLTNLGIVDPQQLCRNVCSPGGTTIEAIKVLEEEGFIETVGKAAFASAAKSKLMAK